MIPVISYAVLEQITEQRRGTFDFPCPLCGSDRRSESNRRRRVLRVWHTSPGFMTYSCARCGVAGYARANQAAQPLPVSLPEGRLEEQTTPPASNEARRDKARWLWSRRHPIEGTPAETYLRKARAYGGPLPATLGFLAPRGKHSPAMIAAFGGASEPEPSIVCISNDAVTGVHLTRLAPDGRQKAGTETDKMMIGTPLGSPIVLAPPGDLGGLAIAEGIEDALSVHEATGLGVWAAGAASFMPALAAAVPDWIECVTILVDDDNAGRTNADALAEQLESRGFSVRLIVPPQTAERHT
jgi:Toprim domain